MILFISNFVQNWWNNEAFRKLVLSFDEHIRRYLSPIKLITIEAVY